MHAKTQLCKWVLRSWKGRNQTGECYNRSCADGTRAHTHTSISYNTSMLHHYSIHAIITATERSLLCNSSKYEHVTTGKSDLPLSCELMFSKVSAFGTAAGIFGSLWAEVVPTIQNPLNATTATARGLWDCTILLSKGIRAHTTWPLSFCVCVSQMTRLPCTAILLQALQRPWGQLRLKLQMVSKVSAT